MWKFIWFVVSMSFFNQTLLVQSNPEDFINIFLSTLRCLEAIQADPTAMFYEELAAHTTTVRTIATVVRRNGGVEARECLLVLERLCEHLNAILLEAEDRVRAVAASTAPTVSTGLPGRPRYDLTADQINLCLDLGYNWQGIASVFNMDRSTIFRHRTRLNIPPLNYSAISQEELRSAIQSVLRDTPNAGETYVRGSLLGMGLRIQRWRVRDALRIIDPVGRCVRHRRAIHRRIYTVRAPNELW